jgi:hypothetical protein
VCQLSKNYRPLALAAVKKIQAAMKGKPWLVMQTRKKQPGTSKWILLRTTQQTPKMAKAVFVPCKALYSKHLGQTNRTNSP